MRASLSRWSLAGAMLGTLLCGLSGCKTGVTSPTEWLSWGKKPSPTALSSSGPKKPSATGLPSPHGATGGQTGLASNSYPNYGQQGYPAATATNPSNTYDTGPYGMASHSTPGLGQSDTSPYGLAAATGRSQYGDNATSPYGGPTSQYGNSGMTQPAAYPGADNSVRTADTRSATQPNAYGQSANAYGGQQAYGSESQGYGQSAGQGYDAQLASNPNARGNDTTGLSRAGGAFQPGSIRNSAELPSNSGGANGYPNATAPTSYPNSVNSPSGSYPGTTSGSYPGTTSGSYPAPGGQATGAGSYPASNYPTSGYPATGGSAYPATSGAGQNYSSPYPTTGGY